MQRLCQGGNKVVILIWGNFVIFPCLFDRISRLQLTSKQVLEGLGVGDLNALVFAVQCIHKAENNMEDIEKRAL